MEKKRKGKSKDHDEDDESVLEDYHAEEEREKEAPLAFSKKVFTLIQSRQVYMNFSPSFMAQNLFQAKRRGRQGLNKNESNKTREVTEIEKDNHDGQFGQEAGLEEASPHDVDGELMSSTCPENIEEEPNIPGNIRKTRGDVYCRKLTALPPGEKIKVEFDEDGNEIGPHSSIFSYFLGQQVRNRSVCPVQVNNWEDFKSETLDHLWACILEKCNLDDPNYRRESVMNHARRLYRDSRHKLKKKHFDDPKLTTKEQRLKNKPPNLVKSDWKYLVDYWSDPKFKEKSDKASKSSSSQKMPHYNGTKSYARLKQEIKKKNGGKCTRLDVMVESRKRKSKKLVNDITLAHNMQAINEMNKLKEQREQGLNEKTDEQIFRDVLGKDNHGYLRAYGRGRSITKHFQVKPSQMDLVQEIAEIKKTAELAVLKARKDVENARKEAEDARKEDENAKNEVKETRNEVDQKIAANNQVWEKKLNRILQFVRLPSSDNDESKSDHASSS
ncbi:hypothetical protein M5689_011120 [Euphorbia peplus]|nr:hypothetical protein M5689_011120 [Euphorbia peplus]